MSEPEVDEGEEGFEEGKAPKKGKRKLLIIIIGVLLLAGIGGGAYFFMMKKPPAAPTEEKGKEEVKLDEHGNKIVNTPVYLEMPDMLVNLSSNSGKPSFLKMKVTLELEKQEDLAAVTALLPRVQDSFNTYLRELRPSDLSGSTGLYRLRGELLLRLNEAVAPAKVTNILFKEILVQ